MSKFILMSEGDHGEFEERSRHDTYQQAERQAGKLFDSGDEGDFKIVEEGYHIGWIIRSHTLCKYTCPACEKEVRARDTMMTRDCNGIPYRKVCEDCYDRIMNSRGYDGERYTELDECIDSDY